MRRLCNALAVLAIALMLAMPGRASPLVFDLDPAITTQVDLAVDAPTLIDSSILASAIQRREVSESFGCTETRTRFDTHSWVPSGRPDTVANLAITTKARTPESTLS